MTAKEALVQYKLAKQAQDLSGIMESIQGMPDQLSQWFGNLPPEARQSMIRGLIGSLVGAAGTGGMAMMTPRDPEGRKPVLGPALIGALLAGGASASYPYAKKLLFGGQTQMEQQPMKPSTPPYAPGSEGGINRAPGDDIPGESDPSMAKSISGYIGDKVSRNPFKTWGFVEAGRQMHKGFGGMRMPPVGKPGIGGAVGKVLQLPGRVKMTSRSAIPMAAASLLAGYLADKHIKGRI